MKRRAVLVNIEQHAIALRVRLRTPRRWYYARVETNTSMFDHHIRTMGQVQETQVSAYQGRLDPASSRVEWYVHMEAVKLTPPVVALSMHEGERNQVAVFR